MDFETAVRNVVATSRRLAQMDPQDEAVDRTVKELQEQVQWMGQIEKPGGFKGSFGENSYKDDVKFIGEQIKKLHGAAVVPARNYQRMVAILAGLGRAHQIASRPQNAEIRPRIVEIVKHVAGVFSKIDTTEDLEKPLEQIEKAVHSLYGDQSKNSTFYFDRRNKGHHGDKDASVYDKKPPHYK